MIMSNVGLGTLFSIARRTSDGEVDFTHSPGASLSRQDIEKISSQAIRSFQSTYGELLSHYSPHTGSAFCLDELLLTWVKSKSVNAEAMQLATQLGDAAALSQAFVLAMEAAFVGLVEAKSPALAKLLQLPWNGDAIREFTQMLSRVEQLTAKTSAPAAPTPAPAPAAVPTTLDPIEQVVQDFKNMGSPQFAAIYMRGPKRAIYERAIAQGAL
jgi:hypothetical protein